MRRVFCVVVLAMAACITPVDRKPTVFNVKAEQRLDYWNRAIAALQEEGYTIALANEAAGLVKTDVRDLPVESCGLMLCRSRETVSVTVAPSGAVRIDVKREVRIDSPNQDWFEPRGEASVRQVEAHQRTIAKAMGVEVREPVAATAD